MTSLRQRHVANNAESRDAWALFGPHRDAVTRLLLGGLGAGPARVCVLGAGNCNDLDLAALLADGREVVRTSFAVAEYSPRNSQSWNEPHDRFQKLLHTM